MHQTTLSTLLIEILIRIELETSLIMKGIIKTSSRSQLVYAAAMVCSVRPSRFLITAYSSASNLHTFHTSQKVVVPKTTSAVLSSFLPLYCRPRSFGLEKTIYSSVVYRTLRIPAMVKRVAVVTGGNKGIGFEIVRGLCEKFDGDVFLTARDTNRGQTAVEELKKAGLKPLYHQLDITDQKSLDNFKKFLDDNYGGLDILVNNAAIAFKNAATEPFGFQAEQTIFVNYTSLVNTCQTLFPILRPHARVVNLSSSAGHLLRIPGQQLRQQLNSQVLTEETLSALMQSFVTLAQEGKHTEEGWPNSAYAVSKVGVSALTFIQQRQMDKEKKDDIIVNAVHPGYVNTDMTSHKGPLSPAEGAVAPLYCALLPPGTEWPRGAYVWWNKKVVDWDKTVNE